jgi:hypothetical protein
LKVVDDVAIQVRRQARLEAARKARRSEERDTGNEHTPLGSLRNLAHRQKGDWNPLIVFIPDLA